MLSLVCLLQLVRVDQHIFTEACTKIPGVIINRRCFLAAGALSNAREDCVCLLPALSVHCP